MSDSPTAGNMVDGLLGSRLVQTAAALVVFAVSAWFAVNGSKMEGFIAAALTVVMWRMGIAFGRRA